MDEGIKKVIDRMHASVLHEDFLDILYDMTEELEENLNAFEAVEPILKLIEDNPNTDFGNPGPLVHFVEKFYKKGYENKLIDSLERQPTGHTLWMLNRIINGSDEEKKGFYIKILENIAVSQSIDESVRLIAQDFKSRHI